MRAPGGTRSRRWEFNMTPMIDIVFLLIIFFLLSSHLAKQESQLPLPLPEAASGEKARNDSGPRVTVNVLAGGTLRLAGHRVDDGELQRRLQFESDRVGKPLEVRIRADRGVPYRYVSPVLAACARSGIWNVKFAVFRQQEDVP